MIRIVPATPDHIAPVAAAMRAADRAEVAAFVGLDPAEGLRQSVANSPLAWTAVQDGYPFCMFGAAAPGKVGPEAAPWLLGTDRLTAMPRTFLRMAGHVVAGLQMNFPLLTNWTDARHTQSHALLRRLGFTLGPAEPAGVAGLPFHPFWRTAA